MGHIKKIPYAKSRFVKRWVEKELSDFLGFNTKVVKNKPLFGDKIIECGKIIKCDKRKVEKWFRRLGDEAKNYRKIKTDHCDIVDAASYTFQQLINDKILN